MATRTAPLATFHPHVPALPGSSLRAALARFLDRFGNSRRVPSASRRPSRSTTRPHDELMAHFTVHARANAPIETTWSLLCDQRGMTRWLPVTVSLECEGDPPPDGVGSIRVLTRWPLRIREQITEIDATSRLAYRLLSGIPVRHYVGQTRLAADENGTDIEWTIDLTSPIPGIAYVVRLVIQAAATKLARASERAAGFHP
jgi:uncharacterized protein YndB with AHSA1/START domain